MISVIATEILALVCKGNQAVNEMQKLRVSSQSSSSSLTLITDGPGSCRSPCHIFVLEADKYGRCLANRRIHYEIPRPAVHTISKHRKLCSHRDSVHPWPDVPVETAGIRKILVHELAISVRQHRWKVSHMCLPPRSENPRKPTFSSRICGACTDSTLTYQPGLDATHWGTGCGMNGDRTSASIAILDDEMEKEDFLVENWRTCWTEENQRQILNAGQR